MEQGCGNCKGKDSNYCYACKKNYCNEEKNVYKKCRLDNDKQSNYCGIKHGEDCYIEIIKNNIGRDFKENSYFFNFHLYSSCEGLWEVS